MAKRRRISLGTVVVAVLVCAATLAAGCGEKSESTTSPQQQTLDLALDFYVNPDHAGIFEALDRGYFRQAGLDVRPQVPSDPSAPIREVAAGRADLAISYEPEVLIAHDQGLPVKAVAALVPTPLTSLIWLKDSGITDVKGLRGKTIATAGIPYQDAYLSTILERAGLSTSDVNAVDVQQGLLPAILSGRADAMLGGFLNVEGVDLKLRGKDPTVIPVDRLGIPTYDELVVVANSDELVELLERDRAVPRRAAARHPGGRGRSGRRDQDDPRRRRGPRPPSHGRGGEKDAPAAEPGEQASVRLYGPEGVGPFRPFLRRSRRDQGASGRRGRADERLPPERGSVGER